MGKATIDRTPEAVAYRNLLVGKGATPLEAARTMRNDRRTAEKVADDLVESLGDRLATMTDAAIDAAIAQALDEAGF